MESRHSIHHVLLLVLFGLSALCQCSATGVEANQTAVLLVNASEASARRIPDTLFGIFFEVSLIFGCSICGASEKHLPSSLQYVTHLIYFVFNLFVLYFLFKLYIYLITIAAHDSHKLLIFGTTSRIYFY